MYQLFSWSAYFFCLTCRKFFHELATLYVTYKEVFRPFMRPLKKVICTVVGTSSCCGRWKVKASDRKGHWKSRGMGMQGHTVKHRKYVNYSKIFQCLQMPLVSIHCFCSICWVDKWWWKPEVKWTFHSVGHMDEGRERDKTSRGGGLPTLPGLYLSTIQPSQRGFFWVHMCVWRERKPEAEFLNFLGPQPSIPWNLFLKGTVALDGFFAL